jgi:hypothetical protein
VVSFVPCCFGIGSVSSKCIEFPMKYGNLIFFCFSGQGTVSLELLEQVPEIDTIIVPISGLYSLSFFSNVRGPF